MHLAQGQHPATVGCKIRTSTLGVQTQPLGHRTTNSLQNGYMSSFPRTIGYVFARSSGQAGKCATFVENHTLIEAKEGKRDGVVNECRLTREAMVSYHI